MTVICQFHSVGAARSVYEIADDTREASARADLQFIVDMLEVGFDGADADGEDAISGLGVKGVAPNLLPSHSASHHYSIFTMLAAVPGHNRDDAIWFVTPLGMCYNV